MRYGERAELFESTRAILREAQASVLHSSRGGDRPLDWLWREVWGPVKCVARGFGQIGVVRGFTKFFLICIPVLLGFLLLTGRLEPGSRDSAVQLFVVLTVIVAFLPTVFSLPSSFALSGVNGSEVAEVAESVASRGRGPEYLGALEENFRTMERDSAQTVSGVKWVMTALWAGWWYAFWQSMSRTPTVSSGDYSRAGQEVGLLMFCFLALLAAQALTEAYKKGVEIMYATIFFAIGENKAAAAEARPPERFEPASPAAAALN